MVRGRNEQKITIAKTLPASVVCAILDYEVCKIAHAKCKFVKCRSFDICFLSVYGGELQDK